MSAENTPGPTRKNIPGCDRYHTRRTVLGMLPDERAAGSGLLMMGPGQLSHPEELQAVCAAAGLDWLRATGNLESYEEFLEASAARVNLVTSVAWTEGANLMQERFGIPWIYQPVTYSLAEVDAAYAAIGQHLGCALDEAVAPARQAALQAIDAARDACAGEPLDLWLRFVSRPWTLVDTLLGYGFSLGEVGFDLTHLGHIEADEKAKFDKLRAEHPALVERCYLIGELDEDGNRITAASLVGAGPMGKFDKKGRPQGFGKGSRMRRDSDTNPVLKQRKKAVHKLIMPGNDGTQWAEVSRSLGEAGHWGYSAITSLMTNIQAAAEGRQR